MRDHKLNLRPCVTHWWILLKHNFISKIWRPIIKSVHLWVCTKIKSPYIPYPWSNSKKFKVIRFRKIGHLAYSELPRVLKSQVQIIVKSKKAKAKAKTKTNLFVHFLGESTVRQSAYGFIWPLFFDEFMYSTTWNSLICTFTEVLSSSPPQEIRSRTYPKLNWSHSKLTQSTKTQLLTRFKKTWQMHKNLCTFQF